jgi:hypothetical protein
MKPSSSYHAKREQSKKSAHPKVTAMTKIKRRAERET